MRVAGPFKRLPRIERVRVVGVEIVEEDGQQAVVVDLARRERRRSPPAWPLRLRRRAGGAGE